MMRLRSILRALLEMTGLFLLILGFSLAFFSPETLNGFLLAESNVPQESLWLYLIIKFTLGALAVLGWMIIIAQEKLPNVSLVGLMMIFSALYVFI